MAKILKFNVKNVKYALPNANGDYDGAVINRIGGAANLSLERQFDEQVIYEDGQIAYTVPSDKGINGSLGLVTLDDEYEIAMGRKMEIEGGIADVQQLGSVPHALYFENDGIDENKKKIVLKTWLFNVTSSAPTESYEQDTENINPQNYSMELRIMGVNLKDATGEADYIDENGNVRKVTRLTSAPGDDNYADFDKSVPTPKVKAGV